MVWCLIPKYVDQFKKGLQTGEISPEKLNSMDSKARREFLSKYVGDTNAQEVNSLFESKLLLKNQQKGLIRWAERTLGLNKQAKRDLITRIQKMENILTPESEKAFLNDLVAKKLGIEISTDQATEIVKLSKKVQELESKATSDNYKGRVEYGNAILDLTEYTDKISGRKPSLGTFVLDVIGLPRALMSSIDFSAPLRQGWGFMGDKNWVKAFGSMFKYAFNKKSHRDLMADIITRPSYDLMKSAGLRITKMSDKLSEREEGFMTRLADKIPGISASERAYTGFLNKLRADTFDRMIEAAKLNDEDISKGSKTVKDIANMINTFTGSGKVVNESFDRSVPFLNAIFFSPRKIASTINLFNPATYLNPKTSKTARVKAIKRLVASVSISALMIGLADLLGFEQEKDPRSSDFGKIKIGDTRMDVTGGNAAFAVLLSRLITGQTKSSTTDLVKDLGEGYNAPTRASLTTDYLKNKLSPVASYLLGLMGVKDSVYEKFDAKKEAINMVTPMTIGSIIEGIQNDPQNAFLSNLFGIFGVGVQSYSTDVDWKASTSKELKQFNEKLGNDKFEEANKKYNTLIRNNVKKIKQNEKYQNMSPDEQYKVISDMKRETKDKIFKQYRFTYKQEKTKKTPKLKY